MITIPNYMIQGILSAYSLIKGFWLLEDKSNRDLGFGAGKPGGLRVGLQHGAAAAADLRLLCQSAVKSRSNTSQRVHIDCQYGIRYAKTTYGMVFGP